MISIHIIDKNYVQKTQSMQTWILIDYTYFNLKNLTYSFLPESLVLSFVSLSEENENQRHREIYNDEIYLFHGRIIPITQYVRIPIRDVLRREGHGE